MASKSKRAKKSKSTRRKSAKVLTLAENQTNLSERKLPFGLIVLAITILATLLFIKKQILKSSDISNIPLETEGQIEATMESKLTEIYEKQAGTELGDDFVTRFSVYEDYPHGFRIAYPTGFNASPTVNGVRISPESGDGYILVMVGNGTFEVKTSKDGLSEKQAIIIENSGEFVRDSFQFLEPQNADNLKERFSEGQGKSRY